MKVFEQIGEIGVVVAGDVFAQALTSREDGHGPDQREHRTYDSCHGCLRIG